MVCIPCAAGLATSPGSAGRRRTAAISVTAPATSPGTAARTRTPATTAMRCNYSGRGGGKGSKLGSFLQLFLTSRPVGRLVSVFISVCVGWAHCEGLSQRGDEDLLQVRRYRPHQPGVSQQVSSCFPAPTLHSLTLIATSLHRV